jgi:hypothetical protein
MVARIGGCTTTSPSAGAAAAGHRVSIVGIATTTVSSDAAMSVASIPMVSLPITAIIGPTAMPARSSEWSRPMRSPWRSGQ